MGRKATEESADLKSRITTFLENLLPESTFVAGDIYRPSSEEEAKIVQRKRTYVANFLRRLESTGSIKRTGTTVKGEGRGKPSIQYTKV